MQPIRVCIFYRFAPVFCGKGHQRYTAHPLAKQVFPHTTLSGKGAAIRKVQVILAVNVHVQESIRQSAIQLFSEAFSA